MIDVEGVRGAAYAALYCDTSFKRSSAEGGAYAI